MITLGMIPDRIEVAGNSAGTGAVMVLCDDIFLRKATKIAGRITVVDLACDQKFQEVFVQNLSFPFLKN